MNQNIHISISKESLIDVASTLVDSQRYALSITSDLKKLIRLAECKTYSDNDDYRNSLFEDPFDWTAIEIERLSVLISKLVSDRIYSQDKENAMLEMYPEQYYEAVKAASDKRLRMQQG